MAVLPFDRMASLGRPRSSIGRAHPSPRVGIEVEIFIEQRLGHAVVWLDSNGVQRKFERGVGQKGEITVVLQ